MDKAHRDLLEEHRAMFRQSVEVERLLPFLMDGEVLGAPDIAEINNHKSREGKVSRKGEGIGLVQWMRKCHPVFETFDHIAQSLRKLPNLIKQTIVTCSRISKEVWLQTRSDFCIACCRLTR